MGVRSVGADAWAHTLIALASRTTILLLLLLLGILPIRRMSWSITLTLVRSKVARTTVLMDT